jgi:hypothetical protein
MAKLSGTISEYAGRTSDVLAFDGMKQQGDVRLTQELVAPGESGALTTGIQKLAQRFLLELLTEKGSLLYDPDRGTFFITKFRMGLMQTSQDLYSSFSSAVADAKIQLSQEESDQDPLDERFSDASLLGASLLGDQASLSIRLTSQAGDSRVVIYPLRVAAI